MAVPPESALILLAAAGGVAYVIGRNRSDSDQREFDDQVHQLERDAEIKRDRAYGTVYDEQGVPVWRQDRTDPE